MAFVTTDKRTNVMYRLLFVVFVLCILAGTVGGGADPAEAGPCQRNPELCQ